MPEELDTSRLERAISGALRATIRDHGPIGPEGIGSAAKRVIGQTVRHPPSTRAGDAIAVLVVGLRCHCARCDYQWTAFPREGEGSPPGRPITCARCRARLWWAAAGPRGRPRKRKLSAAE